jgi:hypothetical protein
MANPPLLTPEQRQKALEKAAAARRQRAEVKDKLKIGSLSLSELFEQADNADETGDMLKKLKVVSVLESLPGVGKVNAKRVAFARALKQARDKELICSREIGGIDYLWLVVVYAAFFYTPRQAVAYWLACGVVHALPLLYDPGTIRHLEQLGVGLGWRCLEVGAGGGSIDGHARLAPRRRRRAGCGLS